VSSASRGAKVGVTDTGFISRPFADVSARQAKCRLRPAYRARDGEPERVSRERRA
jgi:hypothetical protein